MKTSSYQTVESLAYPKQILNTPSNSFRAAAHVSNIARVTNCKTTTCKPRLSTPSTEYFQLVQQTEQYMMGHLDCNLSIDMLCSALYVSKRTLHNAFRKVVGVGPMTYLKIQRMKQVHSQLEQAQPHTTTVFDIAYQWGFWHMGHFSRDYKQMFGETPSDTLKREPSFQ